MSKLYPKARTDKEHSDHCASCGDDVSIIHLNLSNGLCTTCNRKNVASANKQLLNKMMDFLDEKQSKKA